MDLVLVSSLCTRFTTPAKIGGSALSLCVTCLERYAIIVSVEAPDGERLRLLFPRILNLNLG